MAEKFYVELDEYAKRGMLRVRWGVGLAGVAFSVAPFLHWAVMKEGGLLSSYSHYYYTPVRAAFAGMLMVIGFFLLFYLGYPDRTGYTLERYSLFKRDIVEESRPLGWLSALADWLPGISSVADLVGVAAGVGAIGVALVPTTDFPPPPAEPLSVVSAAQDPRLSMTAFGHAHDLVHFIFAGLFVCSIFFFSRRFTLVNENTWNSADEKVRAKYRRKKKSLAALSALILVGVVMCIAYNLVGYPSLFWGEFVVAIGFAWSWLISARQVGKAAP